MIENAKITAAKVIERIHAIRLQKLTEKPQHGAYFRQLNENQEIDKEQSFARLKSSMVSYP